MRDMHAGPQYVRGQPTTVDGARQAATHKSKRFNQRRAVRTLANAPLHIRSRLHESSKCVEFLGDFDYGHFTVCAL
jgi:hypothetical protein